MTYIRRFSALFVALAVVASVIVMPASATVSDAMNYVGDTIVNWMNPFNSDPLGGWNIVDYTSALFQSNKDQKYYTTPTQSVEDSDGNVTNYYRGGDTTNTKIIDSYNRTFNTIHNTNNYTNNYSANVKLNDFLNTYTTYNNDYTYSADLKTWYYDNDTNNYNYTSNQTYYNTDNSKYYVSIDNSTDEYYLVDIQYSPTFVTVNYEYNTTNVNTNNYGDVTNIYYYELDDGRNSYTLSVSEALGIASGYDVVNYELVYDDPDTLSLQHFDSDYTDSSAYGRQFYSVNRSTSYVDSGNFGSAVRLPSGSSAGVSIPDLSLYDSLQIDFRIYYTSDRSYSVYVGDTPVLGLIKPSVTHSVKQSFMDDGEIVTVNSSKFVTDPVYLEIHGDYEFSTELKPYSVPEPNEFWGGGYSFGVLTGDYSSPIYVEESYCRENFTDIDYIGDSGDEEYENAYLATVEHYKEHKYSSSAPCLLATQCCSASSVNTWQSIRIVFSGGQIYYFCNGDLVGSADFDLPTGDKIYIESSGTVYLDELRVSTGSLVNTSQYAPSETPYDTNMVLALPDVLTANTIYVRHQTEVSAWRIGGVRPSAPATGFFYVPLHSDYTASQPLLYDGSNWVEVDAVVSVDGVTSVSVVGFKFTPASGATDVNPDLQPTVPDTGTDSDDSSESDTEDNVAEDSGLLSGALKSLFSLIETVIGSVLDGVISLATSVLERLTSVVNIFGSFGESLSVIWSWMPAEVVSVLVTAVTVVIFVALIKIVL